MIPTFSPQGDGNALIGGHSLCPHQVDPYLFPARGRKRVDLFITRPIRLNVDPYLFPARGRKLTLAWDPAISICSVDPYLFPARGRKPFIRHSLLHIRGAVDPYLFPARGRKLGGCGPRISFQACLLIPTFSPQGDGNRRLQVRGA